MYDYTICFRPTNAHRNADAMSRLPVPTSVGNPPIPTELVLLMEFLENCPLTVSHIKEWTSKDSVLNEVSQYIQYGWPQECPLGLKDWWCKRNELSIVDGCILWGSSAKAGLMRELHQGHPGIVRMKVLARMFMWWPGIDKEVEQVKSATSAATIKQLRTVFARFGIPKTIVTDNGTCFKSDEFERFLEVEHLTTPTYHPSSNGLAERMVQVVKTGLKKMKQGTLVDKLSRLLFSYRSTPHSTTNISPAELLLGRPLRTRFQLIKPDVAHRVWQRQHKQKAYHDKKAREQIFQVGDKVMVQNFGKKERDGLGTVIFLVELSDHTIVKKNAEQMRKNREDSFVFSDIQVPVTNQSISNHQENRDRNNRTVETRAGVSERRYPQRMRKPPNWYC